ncbi:hypothetical protein [Actinophytocola sp.]|uniref:hypothetical protein n=1 Tax=Actinophytocola sp. TaxID=1872138 RepID=UPI003D6A0276
MADAENTAREVASRISPRGHADLTEHEPVLTKLIALQSGQRLGAGELGVVLRLLRARIAQGRGSDGLNSVLD